MPGPVLSRPLTLLLWALLALLAAQTASAQIVDKGQTCCCSSISPEPPPATYYGATIYRNEDPRGVRQPPLAAPLDPRAPIPTLLAEIDRIEQEEGPMSAALTEPLASLGSAYLAANRLPDAIEQLTRSVHLARVNGGLHTPEQTSMLEQLVNAYVRRGDFVAADEQQRNLYRVQSYGQRHGGNTELLEATLRHADWMRGAYLGDIDRSRYTRLIRIHDLYQTAVEELVEDQGREAPELLPYLQGQVELSYLISVYPGEKDGAFRAGAPPSTDFDMPLDAILRFWRLRDDNFRYGLKALKHREEVIAADPASAPRARADARVALADWYQWHRRFAAAIRLYEEAWSIMEGDAKADSWRGETFGTPLELPQETVFDPGVVPLGTLRDAEVKVSFQVSRHGEATDIDIQTEIDDVEAAKSAVNRAYQYLRNVRFRPTLDSGQVVASAPMQRTYQIRY
jgi:hypothetical protein